MEFNNEFLREIAGRAELFHERVANGHSTSLDYTIGKKRHNRWRQTYPTEPVDYFADRVDRATHNCSETESYLGPQHWPSSEELPEWTKEVEQLLEYLEHHGECEASELVGESSGEQPYESIFLEMVSYGWETFTGHDPPCMNLIDKTSWQSLRQWLLDRLVGVGARSVHLWFKLFLAEDDSRLVDNPPEPESNNYHRKFTQHILSGGIVELFREYPSLARYIATVISQWREAVHQFCRHLEADREAIASEFTDTPLGKVTDINPGEGDRHTNGQTVWIVSFESGVDLAYKPRDIEPEVAFTALISELSTKEAVPSFKGLHCLSCDGRGWIECVENQPVSNDSKFSSYFYRVGGLLCVLYVLRASDCHYENLIAESGYPVLVDCETLMSSKPSMKKIPRERVGRRTAREYIERSVLKTLLLPFETGMQEFGVPDRAGLSGGQTQVEETPQLNWKYANTDAVELEHVASEFTPEQNLVRTTDRLSDPAEHVDTIIRGFKDCYRYFLDEKERLRSERTFEDFENIEIRFIFRSTRTYQAIIDTITSPKFLKSGVDQSVKHEELAKQLIVLNRQAFEEYRPLLQAEYRSLSRLDIPKFTAKSNETALYHDGRAIKYDFFSEPPFQTLQKRLQSLSIDDVDRQAGLIRAALESQQAAKQGDRHG